MSRHSATRPNLAQRRRQDRATWGERGERRKSRVMVVRVAGVQRELGSNATRVGGLVAQVLLEHRCTAIVRGVLERIESPQLPLAVLDKELRLVLRICRLLWGGGWGGSVCDEVGGAKVGRWRGSGEEGEISRR